MKMEVIQSVCIFGGTSVGIMTILALVYKWCQKRKTIDADFVDDKKEAEETFEGMKIIW